MSGEDGTRNTVAWNLSLTRYGKKFQRMNAATGNETLEFEHRRLSLKPWFHVQLLNAIIAHETTAYETTALAGADGPARRTASRP